MAEKQSPKEYERLTREVMDAHCDIKKLQRLREQGVAASLIHGLNGCSAVEFKAAGFNASQLKLAGFTRAELKAAGFSDAELKAAGFFDEAGLASYLAEDTTLIEHSRHQIEQAMLRRLAKVNAIERSESLFTNAPEGELQNSIKQHPWLASQRFDGVDPNLNPEPPLNTVARTEYDNAQREQEMEKQLRLNNVPKFSSAPKPRPA